MKRKLCSIVLGMFAIILLMGASSERNATLAAELPVDVLLENGTADAKSINNQEAETALTAGVALYETEDMIPVDASLLVDKEAVSTETRKTMINGVTYVALKEMALALDSSAAVKWNQSTYTVSLYTPNLNLYVKNGDDYLVANSRYLYIADGVQTVDGVIMVPLSVLAEAFDAKVYWDGSNGITYVTTGSGGIVNGNAYYDQDDLFWMSRVIAAESGGESMAGKIAVGTVILNRVNSSIFPNTIESVLAQKNQFSTYRGGALANKNPNADSVIAAKIVLDGGGIDKLQYAQYFDSTSGNSWAARNKACVATIGGHSFYA